MSELIHQFGIDFRLLLAQAVNFSILFFVLYRFAYRPILKILSERKEKIKEGLYMREEAERWLSKVSGDREAILKKAANEALAVVAKAEVLGRDRGEKIVAEASGKGEEIIREGKRRAEEERKILHEEFSRDAAELLRLAVAKVVESSPEAVDKALADKALAELAKKT